MHALAEFLKYVYFIVILADQVFPTFGIFVCGPLQSFVVNVCTLCILGP